MSSVKVHALMKESEKSGVSHIVRVSKSDSHTLVVKQGGATACLRFTQTVTAADLLQFCVTELGWQVEGQPFVVDGERYAASKAKAVALEPATARVDVGQTLSPSVAAALVPSVMEVSREAGSKG